MYGFNLVNLISSFQDAEAHGSGKKISSNIAMLERNRFDSERGEVCLRYVAAVWAYGV
jgi:hypothetical protein